MYKFDVSGYQIYTFEIINSMVQFHRNLKSKLYENLLYAIQLFSLPNCAYCMTQILIAFDLRFNSNDDYEFRQVKPKWKKIHSFDKNWSVEYINSMVF